MTKYINLFGGPGISKSTTAAGVFFKLKTLGVNCELIQEIAKDKTWGEDYLSLTFQPYIIGNQMYKQYILLNKVDVAITDSPIPLALAYQGFGCVEGFDKVLISQFNLFDNINILLDRDSDLHPYNPKGRNQTEQEAIEKDRQILGILQTYDIPYHTIKISKDGSHLDKIIDIYGTYTKTN